MEVKPIEPKGSISAKIIRADGTVEDLGIVSHSLNVSNATLEHLKKEVEAKSVGFQSPTVGSKE